MSTPLTVQEREALAQHIECEPWHKKVSFVCAEVEALAAARVAAERDRLLGKLEARQERYEWCRDSARRRWMLLRYRPDPVSSTRCFLAKLREEKWGHKADALRALVAEIRGGTS